MRLRFVPVNQAWAFVMGEALVDLAGEPMFFRTKGEAITAAGRKNLAVDLKTGRLSVRLDKTGRTFGVFVLGMAAGYGVARALDNPEAVGRAAASVRKSAAETSERIGRAYEAHKGSVAGRRGRVSGNDVPLGWRGSDPEGIDALKGFVRVYDNGAFFTVAITGDGVRNWARRWPAFGAKPASGFVFEFDKKNGDIIGSRTGKGGSTESYDGPGLLALSQDAQAYGEARLLEKKKGRKSSTAGRCCGA